MILKPQKKGGFRRALAGALGIFLLIATASFLGYIRWQQFVRQRDVEVQKAKLIAQAESIKHDSAELEKILSFLESSDFKEKLAREQFNLKRPDEQVFNFTEKSTGPAEKQTNDSSAQQNNFIKWWKYFYPNDSR